MPEPSKRFITVVSGLPRTGTSMMMRMIEQGGIPALTDRIREADPDNPKGYYEFEPVKKTKSDPSWLEQAAGKAVKMVYKLLMDLPPDREYQVVYMQRDLQEVLASQNAMLQRLGRAGGDLSEAQFKKIFLVEEEKIKKWLAQQPNFRVLYVNYNELLAGPEQIVARINDFLGGGLDTRAMVAVVDPTLYRQRK